MTPTARRFKIGLSCFPSVGGSGVLTTTLGAALAERGHEVHFISYDMPFRLPRDIHGLYFHRVDVSRYELFKFPDYTLPLAVKMAQVSEQYGLDVMHVHYAVPHATAAFLARSMLPANHPLRVVTTVHGSDIMLLGQSPDYAPGIRHALTSSDAVTAVSAFLRDETRKLLPGAKPIHTIHNFYQPNAPQRSREDVRNELGIAGNEIMVLHLSNLRAVKRIDLLLETTARIRATTPFKLVILAGEEFWPHMETVQRMGLEDRVVVRQSVSGIEDYLQAADVGLCTSDMESFCLAILELMCFSRPSVATHVGGIPEVVDDGRTGLLAPAGNAMALAAAMDRLIDDEQTRTAMGKAAYERAQALFSAEKIVPRYLELYRQVCS